MDDALCCPTCRRPVSERLLHALTRAIAHTWVLSAEDRAALLDDLYVLRRTVPRQPLHDIEAEYAALWAARGEAA